MNDLAVCSETLGHFYRDGHWLFRNYTGQVKRGTVFSILGPNGCGKTTLLRILLGVVKPAEGSFSIRGQTAFVPQLFQVAFDYTVLDMVLMGRAKSIGLFSQPSREDEEAAFRALERFALGDYAGRGFHQLSGGERQLVMFARAMVSEADILILDEPTSALDLRNQAIVLDWIQRLTHESGVTVIFTTHHPGHALAVADRALLMVPGRPAMIEGPASEVLSEANLRDLYGVEIKRVSFEAGQRKIETLVPIYTTPADRTMPH